MRCTFPRSLTGVSVEPPNRWMIGVRVRDEFRLVGRGNLPENQPRPAEATMPFQGRGINIVEHVNHVIPVDQSDLAEVVAHQARTLSLEGSTLARQVRGWVILFEVNP